MPDPRDCQVILQRTAERVAVSREMCDASCRDDLQITRHIAVSREAVGYSRELLAQVKRRLE